MQKTQAVASSGLGRYTDTFTAAPGLPGALGKQPEKHR